MIPAVEPLGQFVEVTGAQRLMAGWWHGKATSVFFNETLDQGVWEILARVLVIFLSFVTLFAVWETGRVLREGKLFELFFTSCSFPTCIVPTPP